MAIKLNNVENIIKAIKKQSKAIVKLRKYDGITIECSTIATKSIEEGIAEINSICKELKLLPISTEPNEEKLNTFALQFPELEPEYTEKESEKMYINTFKFLLDNTYKDNLNNKVAKDIFIKNKDVFVKQSILTFARSNINQYRKNALDFINDDKYRNNIENEFLKYLETYFDQNA